MVKHEFTVGPTRDEGLVLNCTCGWFKEWDYNNSTPWLREVIEESCKHELLAMEPFASLRAAAARLKAAAGGDGEAFNVALQELLKAAGEVAP